MDVSYMLLEITLLVGELMVRAIIFIFYMIIKFKKMQKRPTEIFKLTAKRQIPGWIYKETENKMDRMLNTRIAKRIPGKNVKEHRTIRRYSMPVSVILSLDGQGVDQSSKFSNDC